MSIPSSPTQVILQRNVYNAAEDSAAFDDALGSSSKVLVFVAAYLSSGPRTITITVGGVTATQIDVDAYLPFIGSSTYAFYADGPFADEDVVINVAGGDPYYVWYCEEWEGCASGAPNQTGVGDPAGVGEHCTVTTDTLDDADSLVVGFAANGVTQIPSEWSPPTGFTLGLNFQDWNGITSGCSMYRVTDATTPLVMTMTGDGAYNDGRIAYAVFSAGAAPPPATDGNPILFGMNF